MADLRLPPLLYWSPSLGQHLDGIEGPDELHGLLHDVHGHLYAWVDGASWSLLPADKRPADAVQLVCDTPRAPLTGLPTAATMTDNQIMATLRRWRDAAEAERDTARAEAERLRGDLARSISEVQGWRDTALEVQRRADRMRPVVESARGRLAEIATELLRQTHIVASEGQLRALEGIALDIDDVAAQLGATTEEAGRG